jgi:hypothetical protein
MSLAHDNSNRDRDTRLGMNFYEKGKGGCG